MPNISVKITSTFYGYARVSTVDQDPEMQILALRQAGCKQSNIYVDHGRSGMHVDRPQLNKCLRRLQRGDMLVIWKLDRLGRNTRHLLQIVEELQQRGVNFRCITQNLDTSTPMGTVIFTVFAAFAQYEHSLLLERTSEGRKLALQNNKKFGRKPSMSKEKRASAARLFKSGASMDEMVVSLGVSKSTIYRNLREMLPSRFPRSKKKKPAAPITPEPVPLCDRLLDTELDLILSATDPVTRLALEEQFGITQWEAMNQKTRGRRPDKTAGKMRKTKDIRRLD